jgi:hypothetical protein
MLSVSQGSISVACMRRQLVCVQCSITQHLPSVLHHSYFLFIQTDSKQASSVLTIPSFNQSVITLLLKSEHKGSDGWIRLIEG